MSAPRRRRGEGGLTLIELIVTVAIMGIAFVTIMAGMTTSILTSDIHRRQATGETLLKNAAEAVQHAPYVDCQPQATVKTVYGISDPPGYSISVVIAYGNASNSSFSTTTSTPPSCPPDHGLQRLTLTATDTAGRDAEGPLEVIKRKPT